MYETLSNESVEVLIGRLRDIQVSLADVVDSLIVDHELQLLLEKRRNYRAVRIFKGSMSRENRVVWLHDTGSDLRRGIDSELKFRLLSVVHSQTFEEEGTESRSSATTE